MLVCRNTPKYFSAETQSKIIARFQFALGETLSKDGAKQRGVKESGAKSK